MRKVFVLCVVACAVASALASEPSSYGKYQHEPIKHDDNKEKEVHKKVIIIKKKLYPAHKPTYSPTESPTSSPTISPTTPEPTYSPTISPTQSPTPAPTKKIYKKITKKECYYELVGNGFCRTKEGWKPRHKTVCHGGSCNLKQCKKKCFDDDSCQGIEYNPGRNCELHMTSVDFVKEDYDYKSECYRLVCKVKELKIKKELHEPEEEYYQTEAPTPLYEPEEHEKPNGIKKAVLKKLLEKAKH